MEKMDTHNILLMNDKKKGKFVVMWQDKENTYNLIIIYSNYYTFQNEFQ
jgi:hypothetical protein